MLNLDTGDVIRQQPGELTSSDDDVRPGGIHLVGRAVGWEVETTIPAQGLTEERWSVDVHLVNPDGTGTTTSIIKDATAAQKVTTMGDPTFGTPYGYGVPGLLTRQEWNANDGGAPTGPYSLVAPDGTVRWTVEDLPHEGNNSQTFPGNPAVVDNGSVFLDAQTGALLPIGIVLATDVCRARSLALTEATSGGMDVLVTTGPGQVTTTTPTARTVGDAFITTAGYLTWQGGNLVALAPDGTQLWTLASTIVSGVEGAWAGGSSSRTRRGSE